MADSGEHPTSEATLDDTLDAYTVAPPSPQTQADLFAGEWTSAVPLPDGTFVGGPRADLFADERIDWMLDQLGSLAGMRVLELGPLEGGHTAMLEQAGAARVVAVEAHQRAFLRCLVVKNLLDLRARFELGDFVAYLRQQEQTWDLCVASGVLYHMADPLELLELVGRRAERVFLWTHHYDADVLRERTDVAARFAGTAEESTRGGYTATLHRYEYGEGAAAPSFCGGSRPHTSWMAKQDILGALEHYGFSSFRTAFDDPWWPHGPAFALLAERSG